MISGDDLAFVRLAMRRRLVSAGRIRDAVERKRWDQAERTLAEILVEMGALDAAAVSSLQKELGPPERVTQSSELARQEGWSNSEGVSGPALPPPPKAAPGSKLQPSDTSDEHDKAKPKHPTKIGRYEITRLIGAGAMGAVYAARDPDLDRPVALKILQGEGAPTARAVARFRREAKLTARLDHPNIVRIHGAGVEDGYHYIAMDLVDGRSLAELVAIGEVSPRRAIHLARKIALAIQHAHERGVLHRDLKPANVLVDEKGEPRVTDFGLAVLAEPDESDRLTRTGAAVGTPAYMSPEQARGELSEIDPRTDIYSLGATLYEMLTGGPPFEAPTFLELARKICDADPVPPRKKNPAVPLDLETICLKAIEKEKEARFQTAADMAQDLERLLHDAPIEARRPSPAKRARRWAARRRGLVATAAALAIVGLGAVGRWYRQPGILTVTTHPEGARVFLNGIEVKTPVMERAVPAGRYELTFELDGYDRVPLGDPWIEVGRGGSVSREVDLVPLKGTLRLTSKPAGARVRLSRLDASGDEQPFAHDLTTPLEKLLPEGEYVARLELAGYLTPPPVRKITIRKGGAETARHVDLQPDDASLELEVDPRGTMVHAERAGTQVEVPAVDDTVSLRLGEGGYQVSATKPGWLPWIFQGSVAGKQRRRASLVPERAWSRGLLGKVVAPPVVADVEGKGAPDVLVLEEDEDGRWLTLLGGGGETGARWRERTDATAILPVLGDVDQDGTLDVALETPTGFEARDGATGKRFFKSPVPEASKTEVPPGGVRCCAFLTKSQGSLAIVGAYLGSPEDASVRLTVTGTGTPRGWETRDLLDEAARAAIGADWPVGPPSSRPVVTLVPSTDRALESEGMDTTGSRTVVALAFPKRIVALDAPVEFVNGAKGPELRESKPPVVVSLASCTPDSELVAIELAPPPPRVSTGGQVVVVPRSGPLTLVSIAERRPLAQYGTADARFADARAVTFKKNKAEVRVLSVRDLATGRTILLGYDRPRGLHELGAVERADAVVLSADPFAPALARTHRAAPDELFWARGRVYDPRGEEIPELSTDAQTWALEGPLATADLDGCGAPEILAPARDGRGLVALSPQPLLRFRARPPEVRSASDVRGLVVADLGPEGDPAIALLTPTRLVALDARDGRTRFTADLAEVPRALVAIATGVGRGHDLVVLGEKGLACYRGSDGALVWRAESKGARGLAAAGGDCCGCGREDVLLADPVGLVSGKSGKTVFQLENPPRGPGGVLLPVALELRRGARTIFGRIEDVVSADGDQAHRDLARLTATGKEDWDVPIPEGAGPLVATAPVDSTGAPGLLLVCGNEVRNLSPQSKDAPVTTTVTCDGRVLGIRQLRPEEPLSPLVLLEEAAERGKDQKGAVALAVAAGETRWARRLPSGAQLPLGPVVLDGGDRVAFLAPSGAIVILRTLDGAFLGERRAPEGSLAGYLRGYALGGASQLVSLTDAGEIVAFDAGTQDPPIADERQAVQELARLAGFGAGLARKACDALDGWQRDAQNKAAAALALARARLALADFEAAQGPGRARQERENLEAALRAAEAAYATARRCAPALSLRAGARTRLALQGDAKPEALAAARADILELTTLRTKEAAGLAADVARDLLDRDRPKDALAFADLAVHASSLDVRARRMRVLARLRLLPVSEKELGGPDARREVERMREDLDVAIEALRGGLEKDDPELSSVGTLVLLALGEVPRAHELAKHVPNPLGLELKEAASRIERGDPAGAKEVLERVAGGNRAVRGLVGMIERRVGG